MSASASQEGSKALEGRSGPPSPSHSSLRANPFEGWTDHNRTVATRYVYFGERAPYAPEQALTRGGGADAADLSSPERINAMGRLLASFSGFAGVPKCDIVTLARCAHFRKVDAATEPGLIMRLGSKTDTVYLLVNGTLNLTVVKDEADSLEEGESLTYIWPYARLAKPSLSSLSVEAGECLTLRPGAFVNDLAPFSQTPGGSAVNVAAVGGVCEIIVVPGREFRDTFRYVAEGMYVTARLTNLLSFPVKDRLASDVQAIATLLSGHSWTAALSNDMSLLQRLFATATIRNYDAHQRIFDAGGGESTMISEDGEEKDDDDPLDEMYLIASGSIILYAPENMISNMAASRAELIANTCSGVQASELKETFERLTEEEAQEEAERSASKTLSMFGSPSPSKPTPTRKEPDADEVDAKNALSVSAAAGRFLKSSGKGLLRRDSIIGKFAVDAMEMLASNKRTKYLTTLHVGAVVGEGTALATRGDPKRQRTTSANSGHNGVMLVVLSGAHVKSLGKSVVEKLRKILSELASHRLLTSLLVKPIHNRPRQHTELIRALTNNCRFLTDEMGEVHRSLCAVSGLRTFKRGEPCVIQGEVGDAFYLIMEGKCTVHKMDIDSKESAAKMEGLRRQLSRTKSYATTATSTPQNNGESDVDEKRYGWARTDETFESMSNSFGPIVLELQEHQYFGQSALLDGSQRRASIVASSAHVSLMAIGRAEYLAIVAARQRRHLVDRCSDLRLLPSIANWHEVKLARLAYSFKHKTFHLQGALTLQGDERGELHILIAGSCRVSRRVNGKGNRPGDAPMPRRSSVAAVAHPPRSSGGHNLPRTSGGSTRRGILSDSGSSGGGGDLIRYDLALLGPGCLIGDYVTFVAPHEKQPYDVISCSESKTLSANGHELVRVLEQEDYNALLKLREAAEQKWEREQEHERLVMTTFSTSLAPLSMPSLTAPTQADVPAPSSGTPDSSSKRTNLGDTPSSFVPLVSTWKVLPTSSSGKASRAASKAHDSSPLDVSQTRFSEDTYEQAAHHSNVRGYTPEPTSVARSGSRGGLRSPADSVLSLYDRWPTTLHEEHMYRTEKRRYMQQVAKRMQGSKPKSMVSAILSSPSPSPSPPQQRSVSTRSPANLASLRAEKSAPVLGSSQLWQNRSASRRRRGPRIIAVDSAGDLSPIDPQANGHGRSHSSLGFAHDKRSRKIGDGGPNEQHKTPASHSRPPRPKNDSAEPQRTPVATKSEEKRRKKSDAVAETPTERGSEKAGMDKFAQTFSRPFSPKTRLKAQLSFLEREEKWLSHMHRSKPKNDTQ
ncbi:cAMP-dependent protein kinase regulatory subunit [Pseudoscourfieldia marina]